MLLKKKKAEVEKWARRQVSPVCLCPGVKSKQSACFFLLVLIILSSVHHGPLNVLLYSVRLATLLSWDKMCKGIEKDRHSSSLFHHLVQEATEVLFHKHTWRRGTEFLPLCFFPQCHLQATQSDHVADYIIYEAMLKRSKTFEVTLQR